MPDVVMVAVNRYAFQPTLKPILEKYYEMFRRKGSGGAGSSREDAEDAQRDFEGTDAIFNLNAHQQWQDVRGLA